MGQDWRPDQAMSPELLLKMLENLEARIHPNTDLGDKFFQVLAGTFYVISYVYSLRGPEGFLFDVQGTLEAMNTVTA